MNRPKVTGTLVSKIKSQAKAAAAGQGGYSARLEETARQHGFASWHEVLQLRAAGPTRQTEFELPVDPPLRSGFDYTSNYLRSDEEIATWWLRPFAQRCDDGSYDVRCLDGGAHDRATYYGIAADLAAAGELAREKLSNWRQFLDRPIPTMIDEGVVLLTIDPLHPKRPRVALAQVEDLASAAAWTQKWDAILRARPEEARLLLTEAREIAFLDPLYDGSTVVEGGFPWPSILANP